MILVLFLTKDLIKKRFERSGNFLWFKTDVSLWRFVGIIGLAFCAFKTIMFVVLKHPLYWTNLNLHICRIHIIILFTLMVIGKFKWIKYITYVAIIGSVMSFYFGKQISTIVNDNGTSGKSWEQIVSENPGYKPRIIDQLIYRGEFTYYNVGFDNYWLYDYVLIHLAIIFFPIFIRIAYNQNFSIKELHNINLLYGFVFLLIWSINAITDNFVNSLNWKMNNWYVGTSSANDYTELFGVLSGWPQNLFTYFIFVTIYVYLSHFLWMYLDKFHFFHNGKLIYIQKSEHWKKYKNYSNVKRIFNK